MSMLPVHFKIINKKQCNHMQSSLFPNDITIVSPFYPRDSPVVCPFLKIYSTSRRHHIVHYMPIVFHQHFHEYPLCLPNS